MQNNDRPQQKAMHSGEAYPREQDSHPDIEYQ